MEAEATKRYFVFRRFVTVATVWFLKTDTIMLYLKVDPSTVTLEEGFTRDMRTKNHLGTGDLEVRIQTAADLEKARPLIQQAFEAA